MENPCAPSRIEKSIEWLRDISSDDAKKAWEKVLSWAKSEGRTEITRLVSRVVGVQPERPPIERKTPDRQSLTINALQRRWKTPTVFPNCPKFIGPNPISEYAGNLQPGVIFTKDNYKFSTVVEVGYIDAILSVIVQTEEDNPIKPWAVTKVVVEGDKFVHEGIGTFFELNGAKKAHYNLLGISFEGKSIDDYC